MKIALVHDYIKEYGGAERVLRTLADMYPDAPIYTAFKVKNSTCEKEFRDREIKESWLAPILKIWKLYSPLRFLTPLIWRSMDLSKYDLVITSASWYITRGFKVGSKTKVVCYCHTSPRWLYGYETSVGFTKYWPVKIYSAIVGHFMRLYDFQSAQTVDCWIANSKNVRSRIKKFYRKDSKVIYPPVDVENIIKKTDKQKKEEYFLIASRLVGAKGLVEAVKVANKLNFRLKIVGEALGFSDVKDEIERIGGKNVELLGRVNDEKLYELYGKAKGFIALARNEDFGMTVVEAQATGTPVIAFDGGGFKESIVDGETGLLINDTDEKTIAKAIKQFNEIKWNKKKLQNNARRFSKERFVADFHRFVQSQKILRSPQRARKNEISIQQSN
ncbi:glycosyltransferase [Patescibacteria group bacterium]|nr:glycosyltransferase [Patescibacteria group bacterium]